MPKRIVDGEAIATSKKVKSLPTEYRLHYPYLLTLGMAYGTFECDPEVVWAKLYAYLLPEVTIDFVSKMLNCLEEKKLLFRWQAEPDKTWGYWVGSDKPGRLPSKSRVDKSHVASGYMPPMREVNQWLASGCPVATLGSGLGSGERPAPFFQNQESEKSMKIISLLAPISLKVLGQRIEPDAWTNVWDEVEEFVDAYGEARLVKDFETWAKQNQGDAA
jgi:hypothetical protein